MDYRPAMKLISWNCKGAGMRGFIMHCLRLKLAHHPHVMVLMETQVTEIRAECIIPTLGFAAHFRVPAIGFA